MQFKGDTSKGLEESMSVDTDDTSGFRRSREVAASANNFEDICKLIKES